MGDLRRETSMKKLSMALLNAAKGSEVLWILMQLEFQKRRYFQIATTVQCWNKTHFPVLGLAGCHWRKMENCRYTEVINLRFPHCGIASLAQVSTMGLCPLLLNGNEVKTIVMQENNIQMAAEHRSFTSFQMVHTHTQMPVHRAALTHRRFYTEKPLHRATFTQSGFYTETPLHKEAFPHKRFYT